MLRSSLYNLIVSLRPGDTIVVKDISRLTRSKEDLINFLNYLDSINVTLIVANIPFKPNTIEWKTRVLIEVDIAENRLYTNYYNSSKSSGRSRISISKWIEVYKLTNEGYTSPTISNKIGISTSSISNIRRSIRQITERIDKGYNIQSISSELGIPIEYIEAIITK